MSRISPVAFLLALTICAAASAQPAPATSESISYSITGVEFAPTPMSKMFINWLSGLLEPRAPLRRHAG
jgi:hypothetical protein